MPAGRTTRRLLCSSFSVHTFLLIALAVVVGGLVLSWLAKRLLSPRRGAEFAIFIDVVQGLIVVALFVWSTERAASGGGWFIALAAVPGLLAAMVAAVTLVRAGALWMSVTGRFSEADYE